MGRWEELMYTEIYGLGSEGFSWEKEVQALVTYIDEKMREEVEYIPKLNVLIFTMHIL